ncbi:MAG: MBL fold metallo-hydrolase [Erysipelotrichaceae bacterium]|nr:MBL fold metallo-hydrolase [Erysipelotrichaceae bacterium]
MAKKLSILSIVGLSVVGFIGGVAVGAYASLAFSPLPDSYEIPETEQAHNKPITTTGTDFTVEMIKSKDLSIHFMELGNKYTGDSTLIKVGDVEVLVDAGSKTSSIETIYNYTSQYVEGDLDYIIVTHAHEDHYAGFSTSKYEDSLFGKYNVGSGTTIIDFAQITTNKASNKMYKYYQANLNSATNGGEGAIHYNVLEALSAYENGTISLSEDVSLKFLDQEYYHTKSSTENDHSVCFLLSQENKHHYLFTGDLEEKGEISLVAKNPDLPVVDLYKAGHHGSKTSSSKTLLEKIQPKMCAVCCCAGSSEYTKNNDNQFPTQQFIDNIAPYTDKIFVTTICKDYDKGLFESLNGNIIVSCSKEDEGINVNCSNNMTLLKDTEWFLSMRKMPDSWKN